MKTSALKLSVCLLAVLIAAGCALKKASLKNRPGSFAKGADIGWLPQMEASGFRCYTAEGKEED